MAMFPRLRPRLSSWNPINALVNDLLRAEEEFYAPFANRLARQHRLQDVQRAERRADDTAQQHTSSDQVQEQPQAQTQNAHNTAQSTSPATSQDRNQRGEVAMRRNPRRGRRDPSAMLNWDMDPFEDMLQPFSSHGWPTALRAPFRDFEETFTPRVEIVEAEKEYRVAVDVPGVKKEDIKISLSDAAPNSGVMGRIITVSAERKDVWEDNENVDESRSESKTTDAPSAANQAEESKKVDAAEQPSKNSKSSSRGVYVARFSRSFLVPEDADSSKVNAKYENGVLRLILPKMAEQPRKDMEIPIM